MGAPRPTVGYEVNGTSQMEQPPFSLKRAAPAWIRTASELPPAGADSGFEALEVPPQTEESPRIMVAGTGRNANTPVEESLVDPLPAVAEESANPAGPGPAPGVSVEEPSREAHIAGSLPGSAPPAQPLNRSAIRSEPAAQARLDPPAAEEAPDAGTGILRRIGLNLETPQGGRLNLLFSEANGRVNFSVRTGDEILARQLRGGIGTLQAELGSQGWSPEFRAPSDTAATGARAEVFSTLPVATAHYHEQLAGPRQSEVSRDVNSSGRGFETGAQSGGAAGSGGEKNPDEAPQELSDMAALRRLSALGGSR